MQFFLCKTCSIDHFIIQCNHMSHNMQMKLEKCKFFMKIILPSECKDNLTEDQFHCTLSNNFLKFLMGILYLLEFWELMTDNT